MQSGRREHREPVDIPARLDNRALAENVRIENLSSHGARVLTHRRWRAHDPVLLTELIWNAKAEAEIVYCQPLGSLQCAVGLKFRRSADYLRPRPRRG